MRFSRELSGLAVIHYTSGRELGKVKEWLLDEYGETVVALVIEGSGWLPQRRIYPYQDIFSIGNDVVLVSTEGLLAAGDPPQLESQATFRVLGKRMVSGDGNELGIVEDVLFEEESGHVTGWRLSAGLIDDLLQGRPVLEESLQLHIGEDALIIRD
ncbi:MAG TPA: PRC-barrel domain-containing protein [Oscillospiraceae bacterium]|nr:PRC-barrel domain-containing protein [Oscillospiraceae bacterium]